MPYYPDEQWTHASRSEPLHLWNDRFVDESFGGVEADAIQSVAECPRRRERGADTVVVKVHECDQTSRRIALVGELPRRENGVAVIRGDQRVRHRADAFGAPPRRLRIGGDADRAG